MSFFFPFLSPRYFLLISTSSSSPMEVYDLSNDCQLDRYVKLAAWFYPEFLGTFCLVLDLITALTWDDQIPGYSRPSFLCCSHERVLAMKHNRDQVSILMNFGCGIYEWVSGYFYSGWKELLSLAFRYWVAIQSFLMQDRIPEASLLFNSITEKQLLACFVYSEILWFIGRIFYEKQIENL